MAGTTKPVGAEYWTGATDTHKAGDDYYAMVEAALRSNVVPRLSHDDRLFDFGCGNGEFTRLLAEGCSWALGVDVSLSLIESAIDAGSDKVEFRVGSTIPADLQVDMVVCMGVLVCLLDDEEFESTLRALGRAVAPGGHLVLRETLSWSRPRTVELDDYTARYRTPLDYLLPATAVGLELVEDRHLVTWSEVDERSNHLWILRREPDQRTSTT